MSTVARQHPRSAVKQQPDRPHDKAAPSPTASWSRRQATSLFGESRMSHQDKNPNFGVFKLDEIIQSFPDTAETLLLDTYLSDQTSASSRVFRIYRGTPAHYHENCDEHLYVLSGRGTFWIDSPQNGGVFEPGHFLFFKRRIVHAMPDIIEGPVVFLSVDTPRRDPKDIVFVNPADGTPESFIRDKQRITP